MQFDNILYITYNTNIKIFANTDEKDRITRDICFLYF